MSRRLRKISICGLAGIFVVISLIQILRTKKKISLHANKNSPSTNQQKVTSNDQQKHTFG